MQRASYRKYTSCACSSLPALNTMCIDEGSSCYLTSYVCTCVCVQLLPRRSLISPQHIRQFDSLVAKRELQAMKERTQQRPAVAPGAEGRGRNAVEMRLLIVWSTIELQHGIHGRRGRQTVREYLISKCARKQLSLIAPQQLCILREGMNYIKYTVLKFHCKLHGRDMVVFRQLSGITRTIWPVLTLAVQRGAGWDAIKVPRTARHFEQVMMMERQGLGFHVNAS